MLFLFFLYHSMNLEPDEKVISRTRMAALHENSSRWPCASECALFPRAFWLKAVWGLKLLIYESLVDLKYLV